MSRALPDLPKGHPARAADAELRAMQRGDRTPYDALLGASGAARRRARAKATESSTEGVSNDPGASDARAILDATISEKQWQGTVEMVARHRGYLVYHTFNSRHSAPGFPDLVCVRGATIIYAELKRMGGKLSTAQKRWRDALVLAGARYYLWQPCDYDEMVREFEKGE